MADAGFIASCHSLSSAHIVDTAGVNRDNPAIVIPLIRGSGNVYPSTARPIITTTMPFFAYVAYERWADDEKRSYVHLIKNRSRANSDYNLFWFEAHWRNM